MRLFKTSILKITRQWRALKKFPTFTLVAKQKVWMQCCCTTVFLLTPHAKNICILKFYFLDAPGHPVNLDGLLENVKCVFLPQNTAINLATEYNYRTH